MSTRQEKAQARISAAAEILIGAGYVPAGETHQETVRVPTQASPIFGMTGGELRTFGGRARFELPGTDRRATVGPQTVSLYRVQDRKATDFTNVATADTEALAEHLNNAARVAFNEDPEVIDAMHILRS